jgi:hypothetical protein
MGRYITTIGLRPDSMQAYLRIKETEGNFSEWISNLLISYDMEGESQLALIDALRRRNRAIINELLTLYNNNGVVRKELRKDCYPVLESICLGDEI